MKNFKKYFSFISLFVLILNADDSNIYEYDIRFKNKIGPLSFDGLKTFSNKDKGFKVTFKGENKLLNAELIQVSEFTYTNSKVFPKGFIQQVKIPIKGKQEQKIAYDYRNMKIISSGDVNWVVDFFNNEIPLDPISMGFQMRQNLKKGVEQFELTLIKPDEGAFQRNIFKVIGEEVIIIKDTKYPCKVLERTHDKGGKSLYYIAETLDFILVKVIDNRKERKISIEAEKILSFG